MKTPLQDKQQQAIREQFPWKTPQAQAELRAFLVSPAWLVLRQFLEHHMKQMLNPIPPQGVQEWAVLRAHQDGGHLALKNLIGELDLLASMKVKE